MLSFLDSEVQLGADEVAWAHEHSPVWIAARSDESRRFGGVFVTPARRAMGLRGWEDAHEGTTDTGDPWVLFDLEKLIRMALRQSGLAFEFLTSSVTWSPDSFPARKLAESAITRDVAQYYADVARPLLDSDTPDRWRWRSLLTGWALATRGEVSHDLSTLQRLAEVDEPSSDDAGRLLEEMRAGEALPKTPSDYDWLNEMLVDARMEAE
jgi:hypothetical protein